VVGRARGAIARLAAPRLTSDGFPPSSVVAPLIGERITAQEAALLESAVTMSRSVSRLCGILGVRSQLTESLSAESACSALTEMDCACDRLSDLESLQAEVTIEREAAA
jgi:hypothetical protein